MDQASSGQIVLLDVRPEPEYNHAHLKGASSIPLSPLKRRVEDLPKDKMIVAYCRGPYCILSEEAVTYLRKKGFQAYRFFGNVGHLSCTD
ncbi:rhodanese-like domain-containing protein [Cellulosispirillum alkaliphilum]|uniref:rhodanese-like domain-containing protein n=1 Tax=Cellulosispirillum alkaliphilum TaxID=3039283 RepID=UPI003D6DE684